jgi:hypothetical protein
VGFTSQFRIRLIFCAKFAFHALKIKDALQEVLGSDNLAVKKKVRVLELLKYGY